MGLPESLAHRRPGDKIDATQSKGNHFRPGSVWPLWDCAAQRIEVTHGFRVFMGARQFQTLSQADCSKGPTRIPILFRSCNGNASRTDHSALAGLPPGCRTTANYDFISSAKHSVRQRGSVSKIREAK